MTESMWKIFCLHLVIETLCLVIETLYLVIETLLNLILVLSSIVLDTPDVYASNTTDTLSDHIERSSNSTETDGMQQQIQTHKQLQESEESWEMLKDDLQQLNTVIHEFSTHVNVSRL